MALSNGRSTSVVDLGHWLARRFADVCDDPQDRAPIGSDMTDLIALNLQPVRHHAACPGLRRTCNHNVCFDGLARRDDFDNLAGSEANVVWTIVDLQTHQGVPLTSLQLELGVGIDSSRQGARVEPWNGDRLRGPG